MPLGHDAIWAEDGNASAQTEVGPKLREFESMYKSWTELLDRVRDIRLEYQSAGAVKRAQLRQEYESLIAQTDDMMPKLFEAAEEAFDENPNGGGQLIPFLCEICNYRAENGRYQEAMTLGQKLLDHNVHIAAIYIAMAKAAFALEEWDKCAEYLKVVRDSGIQDQEADYYYNSLEFYKKAWAKEQELRKAEAEADDLPRVLLKTTKGEIVVELFEDQAPNTVANFISLVEKGFYDGVAFHRVIPGFMAQGGDPRGDGTGGPGYRIRDEYDQPGARLHFRGSLSMANTGQPDTNGSQFFITYMPTGHLNGKHTVFGRVIKGMDVVDKLQPRDPQRDTDVEPDKILEAKVLRKRDHEYKPETLPE
ncbi:hypothetical protein JCM19992_28240 [Thermostilla marina]